MSSMELFSRARGHYVCVDRLTVTSQPAHRRKEAQAYVSAVQKLYQVTKIVARAKFALGWSRPKRGPGVGWSQPRNRPSGAFRLDYSVYTGVIINKYDN